MNRNSNPGDVEARFINTYTPAHYINYFKLLAEMGRREPGKPMNPEYNRRAMAYFATIGVSEEEMKKVEDETSSARPGNVDGS